MKNNLSSYTEVINLPLDFSKEVVLPKSLEEFKEIINTDNFKYGFKVCGKKIIPFYEFFVNTGGYLTDDIGKLFNRLHSPELYYVTILGGFFSINIDEKLNNNRLSKLIIIIKEKFLGIISLNKKDINPNEVTDPYVIQAIKSFLSNIPNISGTSINFSSIIEEDDKFIVVLNFMIKYFDDTEHLHIKDWIRVEILKDEEKTVIIK